MIFLLYRVLQAVLSPLILVYFLFRGLRDRRYVSQFAERLGALPPIWKQTAPGAIWLHAVSVGEVLSAISLLEALRTAQPKIPLYLSTTTLAGRATADTRLSGLVDGVFYVPIDVVWCIRRTLRHLKPSMVLVMETEIWPNLFREITRLGCGLAIVNGRISDKALPRYRRFNRLFGQVLGLCDLILVQSEEMRERYVAAGAPPDRVSIAGNLKYDFTLPAAPEGGTVMEFLRARRTPIWIAASTSANATDRGENEETAVIEAQRQLPGWRLILAPRKPERFSEVASQLAKSGLRWTRRTDLTDPGADVLLLDSIGELGGLFAFAQVVFMGGSLVERGGHNILEPAAFGKPVIVGPHMENFREIADHFKAQQALVQIESGGKLAAAILRAAADPDLGSRALAAMKAKHGATARTTEAVLEIYGTHFPDDRPVEPLFVLGWLFSQVWQVGSAYDRARRLRQSRRLPVPVVSIGNITAGGTGKTPVTIELLERLVRESASPGLLMRGHGRDESKPVILPNSQTRLPISHTGDEAQLYQRRLNVPIGIYADRYSVGKDLAARKLARILLLDDGFQHLQLARDFDLVLIDALHPFGGGHLLPLGRLREPLGGLARASAFLITRSDEVPSLTAIEHELRRFNPEAPVYRARTVPRDWMTFGDRKATAAEINASPILAFCGLGNPQSFWRTLRQLGISALEQLDFGDHHRYTPVELRRVVRHAKEIHAGILLTTAKDAVNLCEGCEELISPLKIYWLDIKIEIENGDELMDRIRALIQ